MQVSCHGNPASTAVRAGELFVGQRLVSRLVCNGFAAVCLTAAFA